MLADTDALARHLCGPRVQGVLDLVAAWCRDCRLCLDGIVQERDLLAVVELRVPARLVQRRSVRQHRGVVRARCWVLGCALDRLIEHARNLGLANLRRGQLIKAARWRLVLAWPRQAVAAEAQATRSARGFGLQVASAPLVQELVLERQEGLDALHVAVDLLPQLGAPVAVHAVEAVLRFAHVHDVQVLLFAADHTCLLLVHAAGLHICNARLDLQELLLTFFPALDQHVGTLALHLLHTFPEDRTLVADDRQFVLLEPLQSLLLGKHLTSIGFLLLLILLLLLRQDQAASRELRIAFLLDLRAVVSGMSLGLHLSLLALDQFLLQNALLSKLILVLLHQGVVLPQLALEVRLQAFRLLLEQRLEHRKELSTLDAGKFALPRVGSDHLRALGEHHCQVLLALFLIVIEAKLLLLFHVAGYVEGLKRAEVQVLYKQAKSSACLFCPRGL
mmetsp:Transcript_81729/g.210448  ORF Transcript_81729/g.210448 Transcript_81729/m.210448 type:complete len:448 (+) Transcript_81729:241-1584(+)